MGGGIGFAAVSVSGNIPRVTISINNKERGAYLLMERANSKRTLTTTPEGGVTVGRQGFSVQGRRDLGSSDGYGQNSLRSSDFLNVDLWETKQRRNSGVAIGLFRKYTCTKKNSRALQKRNICLQ